MGKWVAVTRNLSSPLSILIPQDLSKSKEPSKSLPDFCTANRRISLMS